MTTTKIPKAIEGKIRPLAPFDKTLEKSTQQGASRVYVNKESLIQLTASIDNGKRCVITKVNEDYSTTVREATLWTLSGKKIAPNVILMSESFRVAARFELGDELTITLHDQPAVPDAQAVELLPVFDEDEENSWIAEMEGAWLGVITFYFKRAEHVFPGMIFDCQTAGNKQRFRITSVDGRSDAVAKFTHSTSTAFQKSSLPMENTPISTVVSKIDIPDIPGLQQETVQLRRFLRCFGTKFLYNGQQQSCGIVIHGGRGTGKSYVLDRIAATKWGRVFRIEENSKSSTVEEIFKQARSEQPSIILIDGLQALIGKERANSSAIIHKLGQQLDQLAEEASANNALPKVLVMATCLDYTLDVPEELQKHTRFEQNIPLSIPNADGRLDILKALDVPAQPEEKNELLGLLSRETHAFNPNDLNHLITTAKQISAERLDPEGYGYDARTMPEPFLSRSDLQNALRCTKPTAMHDINLKPPTVHWNDVGGLHELKNELKFMISLTKTNNPSVRKLVIKPPRGLLLYGPPGCSKTLSAQAMATESGFNFFAVKGAELLNMYVGESERALRQVFSRARAASPSIIFFDEIDSISGQRSSIGPKSHNSVNMLTTLLNEMDGFETLSGVLILAATNRPEAMDPALLRPGRFDKKVYVGLPDAAGREAVFKLNLDKVPTADDVDLAELSRLSHGFSGAEIQQIVYMATQPALKKALQEEGSGDGDQPQVCMQDVVAAIELMPKGVTEEMLQEYQKWARQFSRF